MQDPCRPNDEGVLLLRSWFFGCGWQWMGFVDATPGRAWNHIVCCHLSVGRREFSAESSVLSALLAWTDRPVAGELAPKTLQYT